VDSKVSDVLLRVVASFLVVVVFVCADEHFEVFDFVGWLECFKQILYFPYFSEHVNHLREDLFVNDVGSYLGAAWVRLFYHRLRVGNGLVLGFKALVASRDQLVEFFFNDCLIGPRVASPSAAVLLHLNRVGSLLLGRLQVLLALSEAKHRDHRLILLGIQLNHWLLLLVHSDVMKLLANFQKERVEDLHEIRNFKNENVGNAPLYRTERVAIVRQVLLFDRVHEFKQEAFE
jgi:hypothetical protein